MKFVLIRELVGNKKKINVDFHMVVSLLIKTIISKPPELVLT